MTAGAWLIVQFRTWRAFIDETWAQFGEHDL